MDSLKVRTNLDNVKTHSFLTDVLEILFNLKFSLERQNVWEGKEEVGLGVICSVPCCLPCPWRGYQVPPKPQSNTKSSPIKRYLLYCRHDIEIDAWASHAVVINRCIGCVF